MMSGLTTGSHKSKMAHARKLSLNVILLTIKFIRRNRINYICAIYIKKKLKNILNSFKSMKWNSKKPR